MRAACPALGWLPAARELDATPATLCRGRVPSPASYAASPGGAGLGMRDLSRVLHTYPAQSEAIRMAALAYCREAAFS